MKIVRSQYEHLYGCEAWDLTDSSVSQFYRSWNRGVRQLMCLPYETHTRYLSGLVNEPHVGDQVNKRFYKMFLTMRNSQNKPLSYITRRMAVDGRSIIGKNLLKIGAKYDHHISKLRYR